MRQTFKTRTYFADRLPMRLSFIEQLEAKLAELDLERTHRLRLGGALFRKRLEYLVSRFTCGDDVRELRPLFEQTVASLQSWSDQLDGPALQFDAFDDYVLGLWLVSLASLLEVESAVRDGCIELIGNRGRDALYDWLAWSEPPDNETLLYPEPYRFLVQAVSQGDAEPVGHFLKAYYDGMRGTYWHDSHLGKDAGYFGYWGFEAAAVARKLELDDEAFAGNAYYPDVGG